MGCSTPEPAGTSRAGPCLALLSACALAGCAAVGYYAQSVTGHLGLMYRARPIETVIAAPDTEPGLAARLRTALDIRKFASDALALPANASYRRYVELDRRFVVWNVVATPELSLAPRQWCFPVAGCLSYRGYFSESAAETYAEALEARGWDVTVAGVRAYSTLGWFADPLLSSMVELPEYLLARIVFHELAHQRLYVPGDPELNESFAVVVERAGVDRWIEAAGRADLTERHRIAAGREAAFLALLRGVRRDLDAVYASSRSDAEKRAAKVQRIEGLMARYAALRTGWEDGPTYDAWFERGVNNAAIALVSTYDRWVPALEALLARYGGDLQALYRAGDVLAALSLDERRSRLEALERTARSGEPAAGSPASPMLPECRIRHRRTPGKAHGQRSPPTFRAWWPWWHDRDFAAIPAAWASDRRDSWDGFGLGGNRRRTREGTPACSRCPDFGLGGNCRRTRDDVRLDPGAVVPSAAA